MGLYDKYILPRVMHRLCRLNPNMKQREKIVPLATGRVLEVGIGSGLNLSYYDPASVKQLTAIDPSEEFWEQKEEDLSNLDFDFQFIKAYADDIPEDSNAFDTAVVTYTLCSIPDVQASMAEVRRVLKPGGTLLFCEHGRSPDAAVARMQNLVDPVWSRLGGGCHLNKDIPALIRAGGFDIRTLDTMYIPGWKPACYNFWGSARADK